MKEIGGFFELELNNGHEYHNSISLNSGRNCLEYILKVKKYKKIYIPYFICDVILEPILKLNIQYEFYYIDNSFYPKFDFDILKEEEVFLYVNYFGLNQNVVVHLHSIINNLIIDNTQAFYAKALKGVDSFYSPRKFFGVPDGGYLYTNTKLNEIILRDCSYNKMSHLLKRIDLGAQDSYRFFKENSNEIKNNSIKSMSKLTKALLKNISYEKIKNIRRNNYKYLHSFLGQHNLLDIALDEFDVPMVYPFMSKCKNLKEQLINNNIFVATYWPNVLEWVDSSSLEYHLVNDVIALPIDQRYNENDMNRMIKLIFKY
ncbi:MAG: hypothetical protein N4A32_00700 [Marinifilaceae bacterium]|jgi:hypothetical protein|nr:hypothetical protein [Marinifilaceae bacterium]